VVTFDAQPREILHRMAYHYLTTLDERKELFGAVGMGFMLLLRATPELFAMQPGTSGSAS
jgi:FAD synthase